MERSITKAQHRPQQLYVAYAKPDSHFRAQLALHLIPIERQGKIVFWHDCLILPGQDRTVTIDKMIENADIILVLVSPDLIASDYVYESAVRRALERHEEGSAMVIPILLRPCLWLKTPLCQLQALPENGREIKCWADKDAAWLDVAKGIDNVVHELRVRSLRPRSKDKMAMPSCRSKSIWRKLPPTLMGQRQRS